MPRPEGDYLDELAMQLRMVGMDGTQIGSILAETRDHLDASGEDPRDAFGPPEAYAAALADPQRDRLDPRPMSLTRGDLIGNALQFVGFLLVLGGVVAFPLDEPGVALGPGHLAAAALLMGGLLWPMWPAMRAYLARRTGAATPVTTILLSIVVLAALIILWDEPVLLTVPRLGAIGLGLALVAACWVRVWLVRDPVRHPTGAGQAGGSR